MLYIASANHDPMQFNNPEKLDFTRQIFFLSFGGGITNCLGDFLAIVQSKIAVNSLIQRLDNWEINADKIYWKRNIVLKCLKTLPVKFTPWICP
ncbi:MAG: cytochrome P450 [Aphanothece sp. CMT-3BRIN-NPC111]|jgi:cytochrome P450|nr:cytochrome P450 [Aphanothece sp. CMT-3BRIN-NPC111]